MENRLVALKLVLDELGIAPDISTLDDRKRVQKAIYLGQRTGVELGYRFGWYLLGPYSTDLTRDYYALSASLQQGEEEESGRTLHEEIRGALRRVQPLMTAPASVDLAQEDWLELVASLHYLMRVSGYTFEKSLEEMKGTSKERLLTHAETAKKLLSEAGLLN